MQEGTTRNKARVLFRKLKPTKKEIIRFFAIVMVVIVVYAVSWWGVNSILDLGRTDTWDMISNTERSLRDLYANSTQEQLKTWLPNNKMNFTDGLLWESNLLSYTELRPPYQNVTQVLTNKIGACGEYVWVYGAFCVANNIPFRVVGVGYFVPNVVDHNWVQVNPSHDGETWIHVDVTDTCVGLREGKTINDLWNATINNNSKYAASHYKMVLAYELNQNGEIVITDVTSTFS